MILENRTAKLLLAYSVLFWALFLFSVYFYLPLTIPWWDNVLHFAGGVWLGLFMFWFIYHSKVLRDVKLPLIAVFILVISFVALGGVLWEFYEYLYDEFWAKKYCLEICQVSIKDTMGDLLMDLLGGAAVIAFFEMKKLVNKIQNGGEEKK